MIVNILLFLLFSFIGWIIDTIYTSAFVKRKFQFSGYYKYLPFCPVYGLGGLLILNMFMYLKDYSPYLVISITTLLVILLEYISGWFCVRVLKERLWDYTKMKFNLHGHICLLISFYWFVLVTVLYVVIERYMNQILNMINHLQSIFSSYDLPFAVLFLIGIYALTIMTRDRRMKNYVSKYKNKMDELENLVKELEKKIKERFDI
jgi:uncharacterized membrane protein